MSPSPGLDPASGPQRPQNFWDLHARTKYEKRQLNFAWDQTRCEVNFTWSTANADARSVCGI